MLPHEVLKLRSGEVNIEFNTLPSVELCIDTFVHCNIYNIRIKCVSAKIEPENMVTFIWLVQTAGCKKASAICSIPNKLKKKYINLAKKFGVELTFGGNND